MRISSFPGFVRTLYALGTNATLRATSRQFSTSSLSLRQPLVKSMPTIPFLGALFKSSNRDMSTYPLQKTDQEWQAVLNKEQFRVLREQGTEAPFTGKYDKHLPETGVYTCAGCQAPLYTAKQKFKSGCGWPAFFDTVPGAVTRHTDTTFGMERTEIVCSNCGGHLGHVFKGEGYANPIDERHCVNSVSLNFSEDENVLKQGGQGGEPAVQSPEDQAVDGQVQSKV